MKVFISWSGQRSQMIAEALRDWLPNVIQNVEPWTSSSDIDAGMRWTPALTEQLQQTQLGIICLTTENLNAPWILFEAGALSKIIDKTRVCPYLLALEPTEVTGPLAQFQSVKVDNDGTKRLLQTINRAQEEHALPEDRLDRIFKAFWPSLEESFLQIPTSPQGTPEPKRSIDNMVEEILNIVREQSRIISSNLGSHGIFQSDSSLVDQNISQAVNEVAILLDMRHIKVPLLDIEDRLKKLINDFRVPEAEAIRSVQNYYLKAHKSKSMRKADNLNNDDIA